MTDFSYQKHEELPALAWCAVVDVSKGEVLIHHGSRVEKTPSWFTDGAWNGDFAKGDLLSASVVCGTGGGVCKEEWCFVSSTDRICPIYSIVRDGVIYVSNSHVFVLAHSGEELDPLYPFYYYDLVHIARLGMHAMDGSLGLASGRRLGVHFSCILSISAKGEMSFRATVDNTPPTDYSSYENLMSGELKSLIENASDERRAVPLGSITPLSKGYDTNATASLAMQVGCKESYTFYDPRRKDPKDDSGFDLAPFFGMSCVEFSRFDYRKEPTLNEAEFCLMALSSQAPLAAVEHLLGDKILLCGNTSNLSWIPKYCRTSSQKTDLCSTFISGLSQAEFRLRVGYIPFCPASIGVEHNEAIYRIHLSEEMKPWSIGGSYDRPIPRRMAEEAGLPRELFGRKKRGSGHQVMNAPETFSPLGYASYQAYLHQVESSGGAFKVMQSRAIAHIKHTFWRLIGSGVRKPRHLNWWTRHFNFIGGTHPLIMPWKFLFSFQWGVSELKNRYIIRSLDAPSD